MAKKKVAEPKNTASAASEQLSQQISNLKDLNNLLLRQAVDHKYQISNLALSNQTLEEQIFASQVELDVTTLVFSSRLHLGLRASRDLESLAIDLRIRNEGLAAEKIEIESKLDGLERDMESVCRERDAMADEVERLRRDLGSVEEEKIGIGGRLDDLVARNRDLERDMKAIELDRQAIAGEVKKLCLELDSVTVEFARVCEEKKGIEGELGGLREEMKSVHEDRKVIVDEAEKLRRELDSVTVEFGRVREEKKGVEGEFECLKEEMNIVCEERKLIKMDQKAIADEAEKLRRELGYVLLELGRVHEEKKGVEVELECLKKERDLAQTVLEELRVRHEDWERKMSGACGERKEMANEIVELRKELVLSKAEFGRVCVEKMGIEGRLECLEQEREWLGKDRDALTGRCRALEMEMNRVCEDLREMVIYQKALRDEINELSKESNAVKAELCLVCEEKQGIQVKLGSLEVERDSVRRDLDDCLMRYGDLERELKHVSEERSNVERQRDEMVYELAKLQGELCLLEDEFTYRQTQLDDVVKEVDVLREEKGAAIEALVDGKASLERTIEDQKRKIEQLQWERDDKEAAMIEMEKEISKLVATISTLQPSSGNLGVEVGKLNLAISTLQESHRELKESHKRCLDDYAHVCRAKDGLAKELVHKKNETEGLISKLEEMVKSNKEKQQEHVLLKEAIGRLQGEKYNLMEEMKEREKSFELLMKTKDSIESSLVESQKGIEDLQTKAEFAELVSKQVLLAVKRAAETLDGLDDEKSSEEENVIPSEQMKDDVAPFIMELEAIKKSYRSRLQEVKHMNQELESKLSAAKSKKRSLWVWLSSATTVLALSVAFITKGR